MLKIWLESATYIEPKPGQPIVLEIDAHAFEKLALPYDAEALNSPSMPDPFFTVMLHPDDEEVLRRQKDGTYSDRCRAIVAEIERGKRLLRARRLNYVSANGAIHPPFQDVKLFDREAMEGVLECITEMQGLIHEHIPYNVGVRVAAQANEAEQLIYQIVGAEIDGACADCGEPVWSDDLHASSDDEGEISCGSCMARRFVQGDGSPKPEGLDAIMPVHGLDDEQSAGALSLACQIIRTLNAHHGDKLNIAQLVYVLKATPDAITAAVQASPRLSLRRAFGSTSVALSDSPRTAPVREGGIEVNVYSPEQVTACGDKILELFREFDAREWELLTLADELGARPDFVALVGNTDGRFQMYRDPDKRTDDGHPWDLLRLQVGVML